MSLLSIVAVCFVAYHVVAWLGRLHARRIAARRKRALIARLVAELRRDGYEVEGLLAAMRDR